MTKRYRNRRDFI